MKLLLDRRDAPENMKTILLAQIYKKGDWTDLENYRGISLMSNILKLKAHLATLCIGDALRKKKNIAVIQTDWYKGFDMYTEECTKDVCACMGWGDDYEELSINLDKGRTAMIRTPYGHTRLIEYGSGRLAQGAADSPDKYNDWGEIYIHQDFETYLPTSLLIHPQGFVDDSTAIVSENLASVAVNHMDHFLGAYGTKLALAPKSKAIRYNRGNIPVTAPGAPFKILGFHITDNQIHPESQDKCKDQGYARAIGRIWSTATHCRLGQTKR